MFDLFYCGQKFRLGKQPHKDFNEHSVKDGKAKLASPAKTSNFPAAQLYYIYTKIRNSIVKNIKYIYY